MLPFYICAQNTFKKNVQTFFCNFPVFILFIWLQNIDAMLRVKPELCPSVIKKIYSHKYIYTKYSNLLIFLLYCKTMFVYKKCFLYTRCWRRGGDDALRLCKYKFARSAAATAAAPLSVTFLPASLRIYTYNVCTVKMYTIKLYSLRVSCANKLMSEQKKL